MAIQQTLIRALSTNKRAAIGSIATAGVVSLIISFEGFSTSAYIPVKGDVPTIGYGQTYYADGQRVMLGDVITEQVARQQLTELVERDFIRQVARCVSVPLTQGEFSAYVSLAYNIGTTAFCGSTLVKKLNAGDYTGACSQILRWNKSGGRVLRGLQNRRFEEYKLCMGVG
jgi:lysozyme